MVSSKGKQIVTYTFDKSMVSDLHKDAYGYRPSNLWWSAWNGMSDADKQVTWDALIAEMEAETSREQRMAELAHERWTAHLAQLRSDNGISYGTALRWDMAAIDAADDAGYYCFKWGISYSLEADIKEVLKKESI